MSTAAGICTGAAAQKCTTGSVVACPRSPWEGRGGAFVKSCEPEPEPKQNSVEMDLEL